MQTHSGATFPTITIQCSGYGHDYPIAYEVNSSLAPHVRFVTGFSLVHHIMPVVVVFFQK